MSKGRFEVAASLVLGWTGTFASLYAIDFSAGSFSISIVWAQVFPLLAALAFGPLCGLIAAVPGLFAFYPFLLWPENGYANCITVFLLACWFPWQGYCAARLRQGGAWYFHPLLAQGPFALIYGFALYFSYPPLLALNPPMWAANAETSIPPNVLTGICLKSAYAMGFAVLTALLLLKSPPVRKLFQLPVEAYLRLNTRILAVSVGSLMLLWAVYRFLTVLFLGATLSIESFGAQTPQDVITLLNFFLICLLGGYFIAIYTERRLKAEDALRESEFLFRSQFDHGNVGIAITGLNKRWLRVNPYLTRIFGYSEEELLSMNWAEMTHPEDVDADIDLFEQMLSGEVSHYEMDKRFIRSDGEVVYTHLAVSSFRSPTGVVQFVIASITDITERTELEHQLRHAQKLEAIGQLAGGVAHDFNNLLHVISGYGTMALDDTRAGRGNEEDLKTLLAATDKASTLVKQILAFGRRQILTLKPLNLAAALQDFEGMLRRVLPASVTINLEVASGLYCVLADRGQIEQVLMNLCVNARDAMPTGGAIHICAENGLMRAPGVAEGEVPDTACVRLVVSDSGTGMSEEIVEHIFEPFFSTKEVGEGSGLGLATVYGIVHQHNGAIGVESTPGEGTCFVISLPAHLEDLAEQGAARPVAATPGGSEVILFAEDDVQVRELVHRMLTRAGYTVLAAEDGEEAVRLFKAHGDEIRLLLFDMVMPKLGGVAALEQIRECGATQPAIFASGYSADALSGEAAGTGAMLLQKPYRHEALLRCIREALEG